MRRPGAPRPAPYLPYLMLAAFVVLMSVPVRWAGAALGAVAAARLGLRLARETVRRRRERTARAAEGPGLVLGRDGRNREVVVSDRQLLAHGLIVGASGAGKSTTLLAILVDRIERGLPVVAIDLKGSPSFANRLERAARDQGREFLLWTPDGPAPWNPLATGNATELKDKLIATERFTEPHYERAAERYLQTALQVVLATGAQPQLAEVVAMMDPRRLAATARGLASPLAERVQDYVATLSFDQLSAVRGLGTRLAILTESHAGPFLAAPPGASGSVVDLGSALDGSAVVLFSLNSSRYGKLAAQLGTLAIQDLLSATGHRLTSSGPHPPAIVAIDEFSALGADHVLHLLARGREAGVSILLATQELADLDRAAPGFRDQVLGLTTVKLVHRQDVPSSARMVAEMAGTELVWERTHQIRGPFASGHGSLGTERQVERYVIHPNEIKTLQTGQALLLTKTPAARVTRMRVSPAASAPARPTTVETGERDPQRGAPGSHRGAPDPQPPPRRARPSARPPTRSASRNSGLGRGDQADPGVTR